MKGERPTAIIKGGYRKFIPAGEEFKVHAYYSIDNDRSAADSK